jgi:DUF1365 family protein
LRYRLFSVLLDLDDIDALSSRLRLFSRGRFNLFGFYDRDHGDGTEVPLRAQAEALLTRAQISHGGPIRILTMPRLLGFAFNPLIVWFCYDRAERLCAIIYEVHNTFGERHSYVLPVAPDPGDDVQQDIAKRFHVSPFLPMAMDYAIRVQPPGDTLSIAITARDAEGPVLFAIQRARRRVLTDAALLRVAFTHPLLTLKVVVGIGWEAACLWIKRVPVHDHAPQDHTVTFANPPVANSPMEAPCN